VGLDRMAEVRHALFGVAVAEILAGAETAAGAGQQHGAYRLVRMGALEAGAQRKMHLVVEGVELVRAVQREAQNAIGKRRQNGVGSGHGSSLSPCPAATVKILLHKPTGQSIIKALTGRSQR